MLPWTVTATYIAYSAMLALGVICWLGALSETVIFWRIDAGLLDPGWRETAYWLSRNLGYAVAAAGVCVLAGFAAALVPAGEADPVAASHKAYQLRCGAIALAFLVLLGLARVRMGAFDADVGAVVLFAWALWVVAAGWFAYAGAAPVTGPALWWLALAADLLLLGTFTFFWIMLEIQGFRMF